MDMHSVQVSLKAIERLCTPEKAHAQSGKKASHKSKAGAKRPSTGATKQAPKKVHFERRSCELCKKHGGAHTTHATKDCRRYEKDGMVKANSVLPRRQVRNPIQQNSHSPSWARNRTNWRRLLRKLPISLRIATGTIAILIANRKLGRVALGN